MEFHEKLQELRKRKGLTQEELAEALFVSRTAISKWESGRGYPNIDSLKAIAKFYGVTIDELLSGDELLTLAEADTKQNEARFKDLVFGSLDLSTSVLLFLPFFGQKAGSVIQSTPLLSLTEIAPYLKILYCIVVFTSIGIGLFILAFQNFTHTFWVRNKNIISLILTAVGVIVFVISQQPYAAAYLLMIASMKVAILLKRQ